jgi:hypothetical protein
MSYQFSFEIEYRRLLRKAASEDTFTGSLTIVCHLPWNLSKVLLGQLLVITMNHQTISSVPWCVMCFTRVFDQLFFFLFDTVCQDLLETVVVCCLDLQIYISKENYEKAFSNAEKALELGMTPSWSRCLT